MSPIPGSEGYFDQWLPGYLPWFCLGMAFAVKSVGDVLNPGRNHLFSRMAEDPLACWLLALLVFGISCTPIAGSRQLYPPTAWEGMFRVVLFGLAAGLLVLPMVFGDLEAGRIRRLCNHRISFFLGEISYGIFCTHLIVLHACFRQLGYQAFGGHWLEVFTITMTGTLVLSWFAYRLIEMPVMRLRNWGPLGARGRRPSREASRRQSDSAAADGANA